MNAAVIPRKLLKRADISPAGKLLYATIAACDGVRVTTKKLSDMCSMGERTVYRQLKELSEKGLIERR